MRFLVILLTFAFLIPSIAFAQQIAVCGHSEGQGYYSFRKVMEKKNVGWQEEKNIYTQMTLNKNKEGNLDILFSSPEHGTFSSLGDGATILPVSLSDEAVSVVSIYPNKLSETYVFQKLKDGTMQVMWTQAKAETPVPKISAYVADCSYLDLGPLTTSEE